VVAAFLEVTRTNLPNRKANFMVSPQLGLEGSPFRNGQTQARVVAGIWRRKVLFEKALADIPVQFWSDEGLSLGSRDFGKTLPGFPDVDVELRGTFRHVYLETVPGFVGVEIEVDSRGRRLNDPRPSWIGNVDQRSVDLDPLTN
jgi:hypothetical protein